MEGIDFTPLLVFGVMNKKVIDWFRVLLPDPLEAKILIPISWAVGVGLSLLFSASPTLAAGINIWGGMTLASADIFAVIIYGIAFANVGGVIHDFTKPNTPPHDDEGTPRRQLVAERRNPKK